MPRAAGLDLLGRLLRPSRGSPDVSEIRLERLRPTGVAGHWNLHAQIDRRLPLLPSVQGGRDVHTPRSSTAAPVQASTKRTDRG